MVKIDCIGKFIYHSKIRCRKEIVLKAWLMMEVHRMCSKTQKPSGLISTLKNSEK